MRTSAKNLCLRLAYFLGLFIYLSGCSPLSDKNSDDFRASSILGEDGINRSTSRVYARAGWSDSGLTIKSNSKILIQSKGSWTGGESSLTEGKNNIEQLWCGAEGCEESSIRPTSDAGYETEEAFIYDFNYMIGGWNAVATIQPNIYNPQNFIRTEESLASQRKIGYLNGQMDGKTLCFSQTNGLIGATEPDQPEGYYAGQRDSWQNQVDKWTLQEQRQTLIRFATRMRDLYKYASCDNLVTEDQLIDIIAQASDQPIGTDSPYRWTGTATIYEDVYRATIPENNYRELCNSEQDIVTYVNAGVFNTVEKNECAPVALSTLIAKIVPEGEDPKEVTPIVISTFYEETPLEITEGGRLYFRSNDTNGGVVNNDGFLDVKVSLAK